MPDFCANFCAGLRLRVNFTVLAYANVREVNQQLSDIRKSAALAPGDAVGRAIETWKKHESYMRDRDTPEAILAKFVAIGKDLNLKGLIQKAM